MLKYILQQIVNLISSCVRFQVVLFFVCHQCIYIYIYIYIYILEVYRSSGSASADIRMNFDIRIRIRNISCGCHADIANNKKIIF